MNVLTESKNNGKQSKKDNNESKLNDNINGNGTSSDYDSDSSESSSNNDGTKLNINSNDNKRKRKFDEISPIKNGNNNENKSEPPNKRIKMSAKPKKKKKKKKRCKHKITHKLVPTIKNEDLKCNVCKDLPIDKIFQCYNGHLLCHECFGRIKEQKSCQCPICRVPLNRRNPPRSRIAEQYLGSLKFECENDDCKEKIQYKYLKQHMLHECNHRIVKCKYNLLGCDWEGQWVKLKDHKKHECKIRNLTVRSVLKTVQEKHDIRAKKIKEERELNAVYKEFFKQMQSRCRNINTIDVTVLPGQYNDNNNIIKSNSFRALHLKFQIELKKESSKNNDKKCKVRLAFLSNINPRRLLLKVSIFSGIDFPFEMNKPIMFECEFNRMKFNSDWYDLGISSSNVDGIFNAIESLNLRCIIIDKRTGNVSDSFRNEAFSDGSSSNSIHTFDNDFDSNSNDDSNDDDLDDESVYSSDNYNDNTESSGWT